MQKLAKVAHQDRGALSKLRDAFSFLLGKSEATQKYEAVNSQINTRMSIAKTNLKSVNDMEQAFGSGVKLSPEQKQDWVNLLSQLNPKDRKSVIDSIQEKQPGLANTLLLPAANEAGIEPSDQRMQTAKMLLNTLQEQLRPEVINTQFKHEFVPKIFMSPEEREADGELKREHPSIRFMQDYEKSLPEDNIQKQNFANMLAKAEGFTRGVNMELTFGGGGTLPEATLAKIYGIKRTPEGFSSVLGFGQGDRNAVGIDKMPWSHETTLDQDASIMKILREVEKPANPEERGTYFDNAYDRYGANLLPKRKAELKQTLFDFADARTKRLDSQLKQIIGTVN